MNAHDNAPSAASASAVDTAIRRRRTVKHFEREPVPREVLEELFELARWAPNHRLTEPWRFRVLGPGALSALKDAAGSGARKLDRAPTLVVASAVQTGAPLQDHEDLCATSCAVYIVMLAAEVRGYASYWRTPGVLRTATGRAAVDLPDSERALGLIHLGRAVGVVQPPTRSPVADFVRWLP